MAAGSARAQEKTALLFHEGQWMTPAGTTATTRILKPQIGQIPNGIDLSNRTASVGGWPTS
jgi:serine/threonine-protein kinase HipA